MTKPTGRPRGRPKTKAYVTLMARVDIALADEVKRYASLHRQPLSVVIRDALTRRMDEYPFAADRSGPHRLAAHEFPHSIAFSGNVLSPLRLSCDFNVLPSSSLIR